MRHQAIYNTHSNARYIKEEIAYDENDVLVNLDEAKVQTEIDRLTEEWTANQYARNRQAEYPSVQECVHAILDDTLDALQAKRASIKTKYPKGG